MARHQPPPRERPSGSEPVRDHRTAQVTRRSARCPGAAAPRPTGRSAHRPAGPPCPRRGVASGRHLLERRATGGMLAPTIVATTRDLCEILRERVVLADVLPPPAEVSALLDRGARLLESLRGRLAGAGLAPRHSGLQRRADYVGSYVDVPLPDEVAQLWPHISPRGVATTSAAGPTRWWSSLAGRTARATRKWGERFVPAGSVGARTVRAPGLSCVS